MKHSFLLAVLFFLSILGTSCSRLEPDSFKRDLALRAQLMDAFDFSELSVFESNGGELDVAIMNSNLNDASAQRQYSTAENVVKFAKEHIAPAANITTYHVMFVRSEHHYFSTENYIVRSIFYNENLTEFSRQEDSSTAGAVESYSRSQNTTSVSVMVVQLYGTVDDGLILTPEFVVKGDRITTPKKVTFSFTSYSAGPVFDKDHKLTVSVDGKNVFDGEATLMSSSQLATGVTAEFLRQDFSYEDYLRIIGGRQVQLNLGSKSIPLDENKLAEIGQLKTCVDHGSCPQ